MLSLDLTVSGDVLAEHFKIVGVVDLSPFASRSDCISERIDNRADMPLVDRPGIMQPGHHSPDRQLGRVVHVESLCAACGLAICEHTDAEYRGQLS